MIGISYKINGYFNFIGNIEGWEFIYQDGDTSKSKMPDKSI